ncbi:MAG: hypothetical protein ACRD2N_04125, partial [Vicinamibacterales bacterium]
RAVSPIWTPDSARVCYLSAPEVRCQLADGTGQVETVVKAPELTSVQSFSPDGNKLLVSTAPPGRIQRVDVLIATRGSPDLSPLIQTPFADAGPAISPDGRWVAYFSDESGRSEVYVRPFPDVDHGRWQVSTDGGTEPRWSRNGRELFFRNLVGQGATHIMKVSITPDKSFVADSPTMAVRFPQGSSSLYDVAQDGRFLFNVPATEVADNASRPQIVVVQNWHEELKRLVPTR